MIGLLMLLQTWLVGLAAVSLLLDRDLLRGPVNRLWAAVLAAGVGAGLAAVVEFAFILPQANVLGPWWVAQALLTAASLAVLWRRRGCWLDRSAATAAEPIWPARPRRALHLCVGATLGVTLVTVIASASMLPHGRWDAWSIWNLKARYLLLSDQGLAGMVDEHLLLSHQDYPLLVPLTVLRLWRPAGEAATLPAQVASVLGLVLLVSLLTLTLWRWRGPVLAALAPLLLLPMPWLLYESVGQQADVPLAGYLLGSAAVLVEAQRRPRTAGLWLVGGFLAGGAAFTKNEGLLWMLGATAVALLVAWRSGRARAWGFWLAGLAPVVVVLAVQKLGYFGESDMVSARSPLDVLAAIFDPERQGLLMRGLWERVAETWSFLAANLLLLGGLVLLGPSPRRPWRVAALILGMLVLWQAGGYWAVYLITPHDLAWHLSSSSHRLVLHLWPLVVLAMLTLVNEPTVLATPKDRSADSAQTTGAGTPPAG